jgi:ribosome-binding protein aMBF1 (putative translation factor)
VGGARPNQGERPREDRERYPAPIAYRTISSWRAYSKPGIVAPVEPKEIFARNVRAEREQQGLSQEALADRAEGLDVAQLGRAERAVYDPQLLTIVRIAKGLGVSAVDLMKGL